MKVALLGYGKMGKAIEEIAVSRNHVIVSKLDKDFIEGDLSNADVAINFSVPKSAKENILQGLKLEIPVISGTTGWLNEMKLVEEYCLKNNGTFLYSSNFSIGVNLFFKLNELLSQLIKPHSEYKPKLNEIHHIHKLDSPSGTAIKLAESIVENSDYKGWTLDKEFKENQIIINVERIGENPGNHSVCYNSSIDSIKIEHIANSREGFALGAVLAAEWIKNKKGLFEMKDVLNL